MAAAKKKSNFDEQARARIVAALERVKAQDAANLEKGPSVRRVESGSPESNYETKLTKGAEKAFQERYGVRSKEDTGPDYDLRGAYAQGLLDQQPGAQSPDGGWYFPQHLPDTYKKPTHETFSVESQYAKHEPTQAGHWEGDRYVPNPQAAPGWLRDYMTYPEEYEAKPAPLPERPAEGRPYEDPDAPGTRFNMPDERWGIEEGDSPIAMGRRRGDKSRA